MPFTGTCCCCCCARRHHVAARLHPCENAKMASNGPSYLGQMLQGIREDASDIMSASNVHTYLLHVALQVIDGLADCVC